jgi:predicted TIM-barrel fold metal-dependent hydrolase
MIDRRTFLSHALAASSAAMLNAQETPDWGGAVIDIHLHPKSDADGEVKHMAGSGVSKAVILAPAAAQSRMQEKMKQHPGKMLLFSSVNAAQDDAAEILRNAVKSGAIGFGEMKSRVAADGPEMRRIYTVAAELKVPVLIHFQDYPQFEGDGTYNAGIARFPAILKAFPKTTFIGHGDSFWANISADVPAGVSYPTGAVKRGGLTDKMLDDYSNLYGDLSANSGRNAIGRDPEFARSFLKRHAGKLMFGSDCSCTDGKGTGQRSRQPFIEGKCVARETLGALKHLTSPGLFRKITWANAVALLKVSA